MKQTAPTNGKEILIVDDDQRNVFALSAVLRARGFVIVSTGSAIEGLSILEKDNNISVILLDMMMPDMDGYEALKKLKTGKSTASIPVVAVTAQAMVGDKEKCLNAGADGYISKPIDIDELMDLLQLYKN